jgi:hypothetical protein
MSNFVSVHDVVFGNRPSEFSEIDESGRHFKVEVKPDVTPVDIRLVASAVELDGIFCFDDYGRFGIANNEQKDKILDVLRMYSRLSAFSHTEELDRYETEISDQTKFSEWHMFGWLIGDIPDFEACYQQWKIKNGMEGKQAPSLQKPSTQNHVWQLMGKLLEVVIGENPYKAVLRGDYKLAIGILKKYDLGSDENKKRTLRINLAEIVGKAQL